VECQEGVNNDPGEREGAGLQGRLRDLVEREIFQVYE